MSREATRHGGSVEVSPELALDTLQLALEGTATGAWFWDVVADRVRWSPNQGPLHGMERGDAPMTYAEWVLSIHEDDRERVASIVQSALPAASAYECEFRVAHSDTLRWLHARGRILRDEDGRARAVVGVTLDVTERRRREEERERLTQRLRSLQMVTDVALTHLELDALLEELLKRIAEVLDADIAEVLLYDEQQDVLTVRASLGLSIDVAQSLRIPAGVGVAGRIAASNRPTIFSDLEPGEVMLQELAQPARAAAGAPLRLESQQLGVLVVSTRTRTYTEDDLLLLELVADRCARAIHQTELFEAARKTALSLQRSLLPADLPAVRGLDVAVRYLPGQHGTEVGGDWYDLIVLPDGRLALVVGDVVGRGLQAATRMSTVRTALRAYAFESTSPAEAVERLDRFVAADDPLEFTTLLVAYVDPFTGRASVCSAGHLPPLLVDGSGARLADVPTDPPVGVPDGPRRVGELVLDLDAALVAYTDGLVEDRQDGLDAGLRRLCGLARGGEAARTLVDRLVEGLAHARFGDDVAIVALRRVGPRLERTFPALVAAVAAARHDVIAFASAHGASEVLLRDVALAVSEACTNVVVHAYRDHPPDAARPLHVRAEERDGMLDVTIADEGCGVRPRGDSPGVGLGLGIIAGTTHGFDIREHAGGGAELVLRFALSRHGGAVAPTMTE